MILQEICELSGRRSLAGRVKHKAETVRQKLLGPGGRRPYLGMISMVRSCVLTGLLLVAGSLGSIANAQEKKELGVRWFGHSFFVVTTTTGTRIAIDPHAISEYGSPMVAPDIALITHPHNDHNRSEIFTNADSKELKIFQGVLQKGKAGEWAQIDTTYKNIKIRSIGLYHDQEEGKKRGKNSAFVFEADGIKFCHLGDLGHDLDEEQVKAIGQVDVLMIPVGGIYTINGEEAKKVVKALKPRLFILPMHYATKVYNEVLPPDEFLEGQKNVRKLDGQLLNIPLDTKPTAPTIVLLEWK